MLNFIPEVYQYKNRLFAYGFETLNRSPILRAAGLLESPTSGEWVLPSPRWC